MNIEKSLLSDEYVDISTLIPNSFTQVDIKNLLTSESSIIAQIKLSDGELLSNTFVISKKLKEKIEKQLNTFCEECAKKVNT
jgi:hypothetical protein